MLYIPSIMKHTTPTTVLPVDAERLVTCLDDFITAAKKVLEADSALQEAERQRTAKRRALARQTAQNSSSPTQ